MEAEFEREAEVEGEEFGSFHYPKSLPESFVGEAENSTSTFEEDPGDEQNRPEESCQSNRFLVSFQDSTLLGKDDRNNSVTESRIKCKAFWDFVDSNPQFTKLIKKGHYPQPLDFPPCAACEKTPKDPCKGVDFRVDFPKFASKDCIRKEIRAARALPIEIKHRVSEERRRFKARREAVKALQLKSGQPLFNQPKRDALRIYRNVYADEAVPVYEFGNC